MARGRHAMELGATPMPEKKIRSKVVECLISILKCMAGFLLGIFQGGSIVMQISFVMLLFSDQISGRGKSFQGANCLRGAQACREGQSRLGGALVPCSRKPEVLSI